MPRDEATPPDLTLRTGRARATGVHRAAAAYAPGAPRLRRRAIDAAIDRLTRERVLDDGRAARAFARTEADIKHRGPLRIRRTLETMGVDRDAARQATHEGFEERPVEEALEAALQRKARGPIADDKQAQRVVAYLVRQGFDLSAAVAAVRKRRTTAEG